ncbi:acyltransferase family protein [Comamonas terrigena]|uniref:acyltransferase family protein n=1 Tax=Comamonas terrigena TaxID=32013 RepID=UPI0028A94CC7|nr:acyltransferase [Comamonas terrigena]
MFLATNQTAPIRNRFDSIQALRGIAALMVVFFHFRGVFNLPTYPLGDNLFSYGGTGVTLFFIISGFVMGLPNYRPGLNSMLEFSIKRIARIVPLYLIASIAWCYVTIPGFKLIAINQDTIELIKSLFFYPLNGNAPVYGAKLFVGWTLNYEMLFYGIVALGIAGRFPAAIVIIFFFVTLILIPSLVRDVSLSPYIEYKFSFGYLNIASNPIIWNFIAGFFIAKLVNRLPKINQEFLFFLCLTSGFFVFWQLLSGFRTGHGITQSGAGFAAMIAAFAWYEKHYSPTINKHLIYLGNISFSIYIWHFVILSFFENLFLRINMRDYLYTFLYGTSMVIITLILSRYSHILIEEKLSNSIKNFLLQIAHTKSINRIKINDN